MTIFQIKIFMDLLSADQFIGMLSRVASDEIGFSEKSPVYCCVHPPILQLRI